MKRDEDPLQKQFKTLETEWNSIKQSFSRSNRRNSAVTGDHRLLQLCHNSPKELMSSLQIRNENSSSSGDYDQAAADIMEQRTVDFDNGRLKGRRLFEESDVGLEDNGGCFDVDEKSEVSTQFSCKSFENYDEDRHRFCGFPGSRMDSPEKGEAVVVKSGGHGFVGRLMVCVVVMLALAIVAFKCGGEYDQILVPT